MEGHLLLESSVSTWGHGFRGAVWARHYRESGLPLTPTPLPKPGEHSEVPFRPLMKTCRHLCPQPCHSSWFWLLLSPPQLSSQFWPWEVTVTEHQCSIDQGKRKKHQSLNIHLPPSHNFWRLPPNTHPIPSVLKKHIKKTSLENMKALCWQPNEQTDTRRGKEKKHSFFNQVLFRTKQNFKRNYIS